MTLRAEPVPWGGPNR